MKKIILLLIMLMFTSFVSADNITDVKVVASYRNATITFQTDVDASCIVAYSINKDQLKNSAYTELNTSHTIHIPDSEDDDFGHDNNIFYMIRCVQDYMDFNDPDMGFFYPGPDDVKNFTTLRGDINKGNILYDVDDGSFPKRTNNTILDVSGTAYGKGFDEPINIYLKRIYPDKEILIEFEGMKNKKLYTGSNNDFSFKAKLQNSLDDETEKAIDLKLYFEAEDRGHIETKTYTVILDNKRPEHELIDFEKEYVKEFRLKGVVENDAIVSLSVDGEHLQDFVINKFTCEQNGTLAHYRNYTSKNIDCDNWSYFDNPISLEEGRHIINVTISDSIGNSHNRDNDIYVDNTEPILENISLSTFMGQFAGDGGITWEGEETHVAGRIISHDEYYSPFNPVVLNGIASDNSDSAITVEIVNVGANESGFSWNTKVLEDGSYQSNAKLAFSIASCLVNCLPDSFYSLITADNDTWSKNIVLQEPDRLLNETKKINHVYLRAIDKAGNYVETSIDIEYEPSSTVWDTYSEETSPNEIMSSWLRHGDYPAAFNFNLKWKDIGRDFSKVELTDISAEEVDGGKDVIRRKIIASMSDPRPIYVKDDSIPGYKVYLPFILMQDMDANKHMYKQDILQFGFKLDVTYSYDGIEQDAEPLFAMATFSAETPFDHSDFLTPELVEHHISEINKSLIKLEEWANYTMNEVIAKLLPLCLVMQIATIASSSNGNPPKWLVGGMKWVCDRVFCPTVPPKAPDSFEGGTKVSDLDNKKGEAFTKDQKDSLGLKDSDTLYSGTAVNNLDWGMYRESSFPFKGRHCNVMDIKENNEGQITGSEFTDISPVSKIAANEEMAGYKTGTTYKMGVSKDRCYVKGYPLYDNAKCLFDWEPNKYDKNPISDFFSAFQCGCTTGIWIWMQKLIRILKDVKTCLQSVNEGLAEAGYCEHLIATYSCELVQWVFEGILQGVFDSGDKALGPENIAGQLTIDDMKQSYSGAVENTFIGERGLGGLVHKTCMMAMGMDVTDFTTLLNNVIADQDNKPTLGPPMIQSHINSVNDVNGKLTIQYKYSTHVMAGLGSDVSYSVILYCDSDVASRYQYCDESAPEKIIYTKTVSAGETDKATGVYNDEDTNQWYNAAYILYNYEDAVQREEERTVKQCTVDSQACTDIGGRETTGCSNCNNYCCAVDKLIQTTQTESINDQKTEPVKVYMIGGLVAGCQFDLSSSSGISCGVGSDLDGQTNVLLEEIIMPGEGRFYQGQNIVALLKLNKIQYDKKDLLLYYEIKNSKNEVTKLAKAIPAMGSGGIFDCAITTDPEGDTRKQVIVPVTLVSNSDDNQDSDTEYFGEKYSISNEGRKLTKDTKIVINYASSEDIGNIKETFTFKKIKFKIRIKTDLSGSLTDLDTRNPYFFEENQFITCEFTGEIYDQSKSIFDYLSSNTLKEIDSNSECKKLFKAMKDFNNMYIDISGIEIEGFTTTQKTLNLVFYEGFDKSIGLSVSLKPKESSSAKVSAVDSYTGTMKLYYCTNSEGDCDTIDETEIDPTSSDYVEITTSSTSSEDSGKDFDFRILKENDDCKNRPYLTQLYPLPGDYINIQSDNYRNVCFYVADDCGSGGVFDDKFKYKILMPEELKGTTGDLKDVKKGGEPYANSLFQDKGSKDNVRCFTLPLKTSKDSKVRYLDHKQQIELEIEATDNQDSKGKAKMLMQSYNKNPETEPSCRIVSGSGGGPLGGGFGNPGSGINPYTHDDGSEED